MEFVTHFLVTFQVDRGQRGLFDKGFGYSVSISNDLSINGMECHCILVHVSRSSCTVNGNDFLLIASAD